jgi:hypothetical protein
MKIIIILAAFVIAVAILPRISPSSSPAERPALPAASDQVQPADDAPAVTVPPHREPEPVVSATPPVPDPSEQRLKALYESPILAERLNSARHIAARGDESAFLDLAKFIAAAEATGDDTLVEVASQVATILSQMHGTEIQGVATELAYSPSPLVAEAAVNAAVAAEPVASPQWFDSGSMQSPADQDSLDNFVQQLAELARKESPPVPEK